MAALWFAYMNVAIRGTMSDRLQIAEQPGFVLDFRGLQQFTEKWHDISC